MAIHNKHKGFTQRDAKRLRHQYEVEQLTVAEIAKREGCGLVTLRQAFKQFGIPPRKYSEKTKKFYKNTAHLRTPEARKRMSEHNINKPKTLEYYIQRFQNAHGTLYDYSRASYGGCFKNIEIVCSKHGSFFQTPANHARGTGCPRCGDESLIGGYNQKHFDRNPEAATRPALFYIVEMEGEGERFIKCGVTVQTLSSRLSGQSPYTHKPVHIVSTTLYEAFLMEQKFIRDNKDRRYVPKVRFNGYTECFDLIVDNLHLPS